MTTADDLSVRSHKRVKCALTAEVWVGERSQEQVRLSGGARNAEGAVRATMVDCSLGGLGLSSPVFFPKSCRLRVRIVCPDEGAPTVLETTIAVQRVAMLDRTPSYYIGGSFDDGGAAGAARLMEMVRRQSRGEEPARA